MIHEDDDDQKPEESDPIIKVNINNIANKLANILYITTESIRGDVLLCNNLHFAKFINDMKSYCVNLIQASNNLSNSFFKYACVPIHCIPKNPYTNLEDLSNFTNNLSVSDSIEKQKENKQLLSNFRSTYKTLHVGNVFKRIASFNEYLDMALTNMQNIRMPKKYSNKVKFGQILSERLKDRHKDDEHLELYIAQIQYGIF